MNKRAITLLLTSTSCLISHTEARSLVGLSQSIRSMDLVDDLMQKFEQPDVDLEQTSEDNVKSAPKPKK